MKKDNFVIEVLDLGHGQKVKKYFESLGIDTFDLKFNATKELDSGYRYYGIVDGGLYICKEDQVPPHVQILTLPAEEAENLILEDVPNIKWCLVWHKGSLKPNIVEEDCVGGYDNIAPLPDNMNEFINKNFMV